MSAKLKTYVLTVSKLFPKTHIRGGEQTDFERKILAREKIHTIRSNYDFWKKRVDNIQAGKAVINSTMDRKTVQFTTTDNYDPPRGRHSKAGLHYAGVVY